MTELKFVTLHTILDGNERNVSIAYNPDILKNPYLLGGLLHGTELIINQELINDLQNLVNDQMVFKK